MTTPTDLNPTNSASPNPFLANRPINLPKNSSSLGRKVRKECMSFRRAVGPTPLGGLGESNKVNLER
jgi:hypothetical protein